MSNHTAVHTDFTAQVRVPIPGDTVSVKPGFGTLPPRGHLDLQISFAPALPSVQVFQHVEVTAVGGNTVPVTVQGCGVGRQVHVTPSVVELGNVAVGAKSARTVTFTNDSQLPALVQLLGDPCEVFSWQPRCLEL